MAYFRKAASGGGKKRRVQSVEDKIVPESQQYLQLLEFEKQLDVVCARKRLQYQDALRHTPQQKLKKTLRIFVSSTVEQGETEDAVQWTLRIDGRLIEDPNVTRYESNKHRRKFSCFLTRLFVDVEGNEPAEWQRSATVAESDGFEVTRAALKGAPPVSAKIMLHLLNCPEKYKLHPYLAEMIGLYQGTKQEVIESLWQYIKDSRLQDRKKPEMIKCDAYLERAMLGKKEVQLTEIPGMVNKLLLPIDPATIEYTVQLDPGQPRAIYDVEIETDDGARPAMLNDALITAGLAQEVGKYDQQINALVAEIGQARTKRDFMLAFADDPYESLVNWMGSQARERDDMELSAGLKEHQRAAAFYADDTTAEAVYRYNQEKMKERRSQIEQERGALEKTK